MGNLGDCPYANELPTCNAFFIEDVHFRGVDFDGSILPGGVAVLSCPQGYAASLNVGQNGVRIGVATYNKHQKERIQLNEATSNEDFAARLRSIEYSGRGTFTAAAIEFTADECITVSKGRRPYRPLLYIVITDGRSKDGGRIS